MKVVLGFLPKIFIHNYSIYLIAVIPDVPHKCCRVDFWYTHGRLVNEGLWYDFFIGVSDKLADELNAVVTKRFYIKKSPV